MKLCGCVGAVDTIDERYLSSFTEEERGGDRQCQDVVGANVGRR